MSFHGASLEGGERTSQPRTGDRKRERSGRDRTAFFKGAGRTLEETPPADHKSKPPPGCPMRAALTTAWNRGKTEVQTGAIGSVAYAPSHSQTALPPPARDSHRQGLLGRAGIVYAMDNRAVHLSPPIASTACPGPLRVAPHPRRPVSFSAGHSAGQLENSGRGHTNHAIPSGRC